MANLYHKQPTLLIGLGGRGINIVDKLCGEVYKDDTLVEAFSIDMDFYEQARLEHVPRAHCLNLATNKTIADMLHIVPEAIEEVPISPMFIQKCLPFEVPQIRGVSSLEYRVALRTGKLNPLIDSVHNLAKECDDNNMMLRVSIVTSIVGGTGSGIFLQLAMLIGSVVKKNFPGVYVEIQGDFMLPGCFPILSTLAEKTRIEANAYAALKEMDAINKHLLGKGPEIQIEYELNQSKISTSNVPYKCCFLYDEEHLNGDNVTEYITKAMHARLFGVEAELLRASFEEEMRVNWKKHMGITYAIMSSNKISFVELGELPKFEYEKGQYYQSYKKVCGSQSMVLSPHLDRRWNVEIMNLVCQKSEN